MRFRALTFLALASCADRPLRVVDVSPTKAAELSTTYHDRVMVLRVERPDGRWVERTGALIDDGHALVTARNRKVEIDRDDTVRLRIDYVEGDPNVVGRGVVHKGTLPEVTSTGVVIALLGALALAGSILGASTQCPPSDPTQRPNPSAMCGVAYAGLGFLSVGTLVAGAVLVIRGALPTNLTVSF